MSQCASTCACKCHGTCACKDRARVERSEVAELREMAGRP